MNRGEYYRWRQNEKYNNPAAAAPDSRLAAGPARRS
jgi:hypothetical protein